MSKELKVSFGRKVEEDAELLAALEGVSIHQFIRQVVEKEIEAKKASLRFKALRYTEAAAIIGEYLTVDFDLSKMSLLGMTEANLRLKIIKAAKEVGEYHGQQWSFAGLADVKNQAQELEEGYRKIMQAAGIRL